MEWLLEHILGIGLSLVGIGIIIHALLSMYAIDKTVDMLSKKEF